MTKRDYDLEIAAFVRTMRDTPPKIETIDAAIPAPDGSAAAVLATGRITQQPPDMAVMAAPFMLEVAPDVPEAIQRALSDLYALAKKGALPPTAAADLAAFVQSIKDGTSASDAKIGTYILKSVAGIISQCVPGNDALRSPAFRSAEALDKLSAAIR